MTAASRWFHDLPVARKLITIGVATTTTTLLAGCVALLAYDVSSSRARLARDTALLADVVGTNSTAAVVFRDAAAAAEILRSVAANDHIRSAAIRDPGGAIFAEYLRPGSAPPSESDRAVAAGSPVWHWRNDRRLVLARPIHLQTELVGTLVVVSDTKEIEARAASSWRSLVFIWDFLSGTWILCERAYRHGGCSPSG